MVRIIILVWGRRGPDVDLMETALQSVRDWSTDTFVCKSHNLRKLSHAVRRADVVVALARSDDNPAHVASLVAICTRLSRPLVFAVSPPSGSAPPGARIVHIDDLATEVGALIPAKLRDAAKKSRSGHFLNYYRADCVDDTGVVSRGANYTVACREPSYQHSTMDFLREATESSAWSVRAMVEAVKRQLRPRPKHGLADPMTQTEMPHAFVNCTMFSPPEVQLNHPFLVQALFHQPEQSEEAKLIAARADATTQLRGVATLDAQIPLRSRIEVRLSGQGAMIDEPVRSVVWYGQPASIQFPVILQEISDPEAHMTARFFVDGVPVGRITFAIKLVQRTQSSGTKPAPNGLTALRYGQAFLSYASADRAEVIRRAQMLKILNVEFFMDVLHLDPGARWEQALYRHIDTSDVVFLFWSRAARDSEWVGREMDYALEVRGVGQRPDILPVLIEVPLAKPIPDRLAHLHFDDSLQPWFVSG